MSKNNLRKTKQQLKHLLGTMDKTELEHAWLLVIMFEFLPEAIIRKIFNVAFCLHPDIDRTKW